MRLKAQETRGGRDSQNCRRTIDAPMIRRKRQETQKPRGGISQTAHKRGRIHFGANVLRPRRRVEVSQRSRRAIHRRTVVPKRTDGDLATSGLRLAMIGGCVLPWVTIQGPRKADQEKAPRLGAPDGIVPLASLASLSIHRPNPPAPASRCHLGTRRLFYVLNGSSPRAGRQLR